MNKTMEKLLAAQERAERQKQKADADLKRTPNANRGLKHRQSIENFSS